MKKLLTLSIVQLIAITMVFPQPSNRIMLLSGALQPEANLESFIHEQLPSAAEQVDGYYYRLIQFNNIPSEQLRQTLLTNGIILGDYIPYKTFMAAIPAQLDKNRMRQFDIRAVVALQPLQKVSKLLMGDVPEYARLSNGKVQLRIQYQANISSDHAVQLALAIGKVEGVTAINRILSLTADGAAIQKIASLPWVYFIEPIAPPSTPDDTRGRSLHRSNVINTELSAGRKYNGNGTAAALADDGYVGPHIDFQGRITNYSSSNPGGTHGDMTGGILAGAGNLDPRMTGMATGTQLHVFDITNYTQIVDAVTHNATIGTTVSSTSYSQGCNEYTSDSQFGDQTTRDNPQLLFVFSAGNNAASNCNYGAGAGWGNITGGYKVGKNVIAVANLDALEVRDNTSSRGPAPDGRIKPDISANGRDQNSTNTNNTYQVGGGTSAACPGIAGISLQLTHAYKELTGEINAPTALLKGCLLNSAEDIGNPGPDYTFGFGRVNALRAVQTLEDNRYLIDSITQGVTNTHTITVPANVAELRVMVYWHDQGGTPLASVSLVNDLDVTVTDPSSTNWEPWILDPTPTVAALTSNATRGADHLNNVEQVTIPNPSAGTYSVTVNGFAVPFGPQQYYLVYEFRYDEAQVLYPMGGEGFVPGEKEIIRWDGLRTGAAYELKYSVNNGSTWTTIASNIAANVQQYEWTVPSTVTGDALIRVEKGSLTDESEKFSIIGLPSGITVDWACPDSLRLIWNAVAGAASYEISMLGTEYMDSIGTSLTNSFIVTGLNNVSNSYWFSVRAVNANGNKGRRANAVYKAAGVSNCPMQYDVEVKQIISPVSGNIPGCMGSNPTDIKIKVENRGINPVSNIPVSYQINGGSIVTDTITGTLTSNQSIDFTFPIQAMLNLSGTNTVVAWTDYPGDMNIYNDTLSHNTNFIGGVPASIPVLEDFQSFTNCSVSTNCGSTVCNLGNGWINANNGSEDDIDWRVNSGGTASSNTGPDFDHTLGTASGKYIYLEASGSCDFKTAILTSPCIDLSAAQSPVLSYWYHMYGANMGSLEVDIMANGIWNNNIVPTVSGNQGNQWIQGTVNLTQFIGQNIVVRFRGSTGNGYEGDMALDDINIYENSGAPSAVFTSDLTLACIGKVVEFTDLSSGNPSSWLWSFNPATITFVNATSNTSQNPQVIFNAAGTYDVTLKVTNSFGSDSVTLTNVIVINNPQAIPVTEDFQSGVFPPASWSIVNPGVTYTWEEIQNITGATGTTTSASYVHNYLNSAVGTMQMLQTPEINLTSALAPFLTFDIAYARFSATYHDSLRIDVSTDCGENWITGIYLKGDLTLATTTDQNIDWTPSSASQWRKDSVDLLSYSGNNIVLRFVNINGYGNNLFLDNINIFDPTAVQQISSFGSVSIIPNPSTGIFYLKADLNKISSSEGKLIVFDGSGRLIYNAAAGFTAGMNSIVIDLSRFDSGYYILRFELGNEVLHFKLILK